MPIMMIEHKIFARSNTILSDHNACLSSYNIMEEGLVKILLDQDDQANKVCLIICVFVIGPINDPGHHIFIRTFLSSNS